MSTRSGQVTVLFRILGEAVREGSTSVHRVAYCARSDPLPLLPSGPGGVGGIPSRRTRHWERISLRSPNVCPLKHFSDCLCSYAARRRLSAKKLHSTVARKSLKRRNPSKILK